MNPLNEAESPVLVACRRRGRVALVVLDKHNVFEVRRVDLPESASVARRQALRRTIKQLATDYGVRDIVVEDDPRLGSLLTCVGLHIRLMTREMMVIALLGSYDAILSDVFRYVLSQFPKLFRYATILPGTGRVAQSGKRGTLVLLATALGLSAIQR